MFGEVQPREPQYLPTFQRDAVLPGAIALKRGLVHVKRPAVDLDRNLLLYEGDVDDVSADRIIRLPAGYLRASKEPNHQPFSFRSGATGSFIEQPACKRRAVPAR